MQMIVQICDLRSIVSKEACRTVAILARRLGPAFSHFADLWLPSLLKQVVLKIQVMSSAADRCVRVILSTSPIGYPRIMQLIIEQCAAKNPLLRKYSFEYICIICAMWRMDVLEK